jgi:hypothetical protein
LKSNANAKTLKMRNKLKIITLLFAILTILIWLDLFMSSYGEDIIAFGREKRDEIMSKIITLERTTTNIKDLKWLKTATIKILKKINRKKMETVEVENGNGSKD